jgi:serine/threonine protein kinase
MVDSFVEIRILRPGDIAEARLARMPSGDQELVVVKTLRPELCTIDGVRRTFLAGARAAAELEHPNIARIVRVSDEDERRPFYATEWLDGLTLHEVEARLRQQKRRCHPGVACGIVSRLARALGAAHGHRPSPILHGDVRPDNVLLTREGVIKLLDFGVDETSVAVDYRAPEQLADLDVGPRTDLFAIGAVLWELLVGRHPFRAANTTETERAIRETPVRAPSTLARTPPALDPLVLSLLAKFPLGRPESATSVAESLETFMIDLGVRDLEREVRAMIDRSET